MSLAKQIAARMLAKKAPAAAPAKFVTSPVHPGKWQLSDPPPSPPMPMAERRRRIAEGQQRRNAPPTPPVLVAIAQPVPTSARLEHNLDMASVDAWLERRAALPREEEQPDLVKTLEALPLPVPVVPPEPPRLAPNLTTGFRGSCKAISADTGKQCALLAGHTTSHRHGATPFVRVAAPDQKSFHRRDLLDRAALTNPNEAS
ncbi:MAG: hypothetical protein Q8K32_11115 [Archangium sp.]|nr:hypothetical protein [Archangium sp.]